MTASTQSQPWYKTWKLIPAILFFPFTLTYLTWKTKWPTPAKLVVIGLIFVTFIGASSNDSENDTSIQVSIDDTEVKIEATAQPSQRPQKELSLLERLDIISKDKIDQDAILELNEQEGSILITISDKDYTFFNETDMANKIWKFFVPFAKEAFVFDEVVTIKVAITSEFIDSHGNLSTHNAVSIDMDKNDFNEFNWDNLKFTNPKNNQELINKTNYFIHGLIYKDVKVDKLKLSYL